MANVTSFKRERICPICHKQNYVQVDFEDAEGFFKGQEARAIMKVKCEHCSYSIPFEASSFGIFFISLLTIVTILILELHFIGLDNLFDWALFILSQIGSLILFVFLTLQLMDWYMKRYLSGRKLDKIIIAKYNKSKSRIK
jgi:hypothetical protein